VQREAQARVFLQTEKGLLSLCECTHSCVPLHLWLPLIFIVAVALVLLEEEISNMRKELEKYGIQMPSFSKIGGILANELSVDEAACKSI
jgi:hypothetical protein